MTVNIDDIVERLSGLTVMEAMQITRLLEEKWGVSAAAPVTTVTENVAVVEEVKEEQTEFSVILTGLVSADKKISVIKEIRTITNLGLTEAKEFVETAPKVIRESATKVDAMTIKNTIEKAGGTVEIK